MSRLPLELLFALRYLRPKRTFVSVITLISILGVMLGVAVLIVVIGVMSGFDRDLREKLFGFDNHIRIQQPGSSLKDYLGLIEAVESEPGVRGVAPYIAGPVVVETQTNPPRIAMPTLLAVDPDRAGNLSILPGSMVDGEFDLEGQGMVMGHLLADQLELRRDDPVAIYSHGKLRQIHRSVTGPGENRRLSLPDDYTLRGLFNVGYYEYDANIFVCSVHDAQQLFFDGIDAVHGLRVILEDPYLAHQVQERLQKRLGPSYRVSSWIEDHSSLLEALVTEKNVIRFLLFFIVLVAAFGITSSQITFVVQKTREIGMLRALGSSGRQILLIFFLQSFLVGIVGVVSGLGLGTLAITYRNEFLSWMNRVSGKDLFPAEIYGFSSLPAIVSTTDLLVICGGSLLICAASGILPALNAGRLRPVESLRHE